jgi:hypothetical protein
MITTLPEVKSDSFASPATRRRRSIPALLEPLENIAAKSASLLGGHDLRFESNGEQYVLPRYHYVGEKGGGDPIRIAIFATIHGDEPEGAQALAHFVRLLETSPEIGRGYCLFLYPLCNPTGFEDNTRHSRRGRDLNREFWRDTSEPEVLLLQRELAAQSFHGIIALHSDNTSHGLYGFARGATLTKHLLRPVLAAAAEALPKNENSVIDGFSANRGIIRQSYEGVLSAPPKVRPRPFEIIFETPQSAPQYLQSLALVIALQTALVEYRKFISFAANI